jgi:nucleoside-diphosphate-sugar epimerase
MNIFVTGGSGTMGGYILRELSQAGHALTCFSRTPPAVEDVRFVAGDITQPEQVQAACAAVPLLVESYAAAKGEDLAVNLALAAIGPVASEAIPSLEQYRTP